MSTGDKSTSEVLEELQSKGDYYARLTVIEKKRLQDLEDAIAYIDQEIENYRAKSRQAAIDVMNLHVMTPNPAYQRADGADIGKLVEVSTKKMLSILEVKLNKLLQRRSEIINRNKQMKEDVNHLRKRRLQTDVAHRQLDAQLKSIKERIDNILKESTAVSEAREQVTDQIQQLLRMNADERAQFEEQYAEYGAFVAEQNQALENSLLAERKHADKNNEFKLSTAGSPQQEEEGRMAGRVSELSFFITEEQSSYETVQKRIQTFQDMFKKLTRITGVDDIDEIISTYARHEDEMFSMYNYIQNTNNEIDAAQEVCNELDVVMERYKEEQLQQEQERKAELEELEARLKSTLEATAAAKTTALKQSEDIDNVAKKVQSVFFKLQCDAVDAKPTVAAAKSSDAVPRTDNKIALLTNQGINDGNILEYLGVIEQKAVEIITSYIRSGSGAGAAAAVMGPVLPKQSRVLGIEVPDLGEDDLEEGDDLKPIPIHSLRNSLVHGRRI